MTVVSYTALHYGADYLGWAIRSVIDYVDEHIILYSDVGSHGYHTDRVCPDSRDDLYRIASAAAGDKLRWIDGRWRHEGEQRDSIHQVAPDADVILVVDADEIWPGAIASLPHKMAPSCKRVRVPMVHFWRSFHRAVLHDPAYPERIIFPNANNGAITLDIAYSVPDLRPTRPVICHMGYAQRPALIEYKQHVHGHKGEWRTDDWFNTVFMANAQTNCHPVGSDYWNPEPVDPAAYLPDFMREHPNWGKDVIE